jgi:DNA-binding SARP family transcriptional activator/basic membrane lipoprotein Med (substrate-binding protein (PBP1-ABC) superfamily)
MEFRLLGPLEVAENDDPVPLGGARVRALLALLLLHRNETIPLERIVDDLWGGRPPKTAEQVVRVYVSQLRKALERDRSDGSPQLLVTQGNGYVLKVDANQVDLDRFESLRAEGRQLIAAAEPSRAATVLAEALSLWRGQPLQEFTYEPFAQSEIARLAELRLATLEDRIDAQLATGRDGELVAELEQLVEANPLRERMRAQLMLALYRSGRQVEALQTYQRFRRLLVDDLGLEPGESLRRLESRILQRDPELDRPSPSTATAETPPEPGRRHRLAILAAAVTLLAAALAALFTTATTSRGQQQRNARSLRIVLVESGRPDPTNTSPITLDPINGLRAAADQLGFQPKILYGGNGPAGFFGKVALAARTSDLVIVGATPHVQALSELTRRFPHTRFVVADSVFDPTASFRGQRNVTGMNFDDRENGYLGGVLAGLMTHGKHAVSAVGGIPTASVRELIAGFTAGARRVRPGIRVLVNYTGTFLAQGQHRCEAAADRQIGRGSKVVFDVAGDCGIGALRAAGFRNVWGLGVDSDLSYIDPPQILASAVKRFDTATQVAVTLFASRQLPGGEDLRFDLANNGIGLVHINTRVPLAVRTKIEAVSARLSARDQARDGLGNER